MSNVISGSLALGFVVGFLANFSAAAAGALDAAPFVGLSVGVIVAFYVLIAGIGVQLTRRHD